MSHSRMADTLLTMGMEGAPFTRPQSGSLPIAPPHLIVYDLCRILHPLQAFHDVSLLLRYLSRWDSRDLDGSRMRAAEVRSQLLVNLELLGTPPGTRKARVILTHADPGLESPAETIALWTALSILRNRSLVTTQVPVRTGASVIRIDLGVPSVKLALELSGRGKFGTTSSTGAQVADRFLVRQQMLEASGWHVRNFTYGQTKHLASFLHILNDIFSEHRIATRPPNPDLWAPPTTDLLHHSRRF